MERVEDGPSLNIVPAMFHAGISNKFTKRHVGNFCDTTLTAASAAKQRAERKLERQADAIEKQQQKIDNEMRKLAAITENLHRQQIREVKRLQRRLHYAASRIQRAYRVHWAHVIQVNTNAAVTIQTLSRKYLARCLSYSVRQERKAQQLHCSSVLISKCIRRIAAKSIRAKEMERRRWAACRIQSMARMLTARSYVQEQRKQQDKAKLQNRAAIVIQCNVRSFITRLIYLDVLYLICRIQAVMRGCLVRRQLRWICATHVNAISKLQAHVRGFLVRRRRRIGQSIATKDMTLPSSRSTQFVAQTASPHTETLKESVQDRVEARARAARASSFSYTGDERTGRSNFTSFVRTWTGLGWQSTAESAIKRSYWLPAGASFDKRLPVLPVSKRMMALEQFTTNDGDEWRLAKAAWTPKKRPHQKPCPARLSPVVIASVGTEGNEVTLLEAKTEDDGDALKRQELLQRQEELKLKLQLRRNEEKRRQDHELKLKREAEGEALERKLMEREEKVVRLHHKILCRRSREGKVRQVTAAQRREERERLALAREERHVRLHLKFCARQQLKKRRQRRGTASTTTSDSESQPPSTSSSRHEGHIRPKAVAAKRRPQSRSKNGDSLSSDDDGDMSFLDIDFTIPASMKPIKQSGRYRGSLPSKKLGTQEFKPKKRSVGDKSISRKPRLSIPIQRLTEEDQDDCGYGDEFDDLVDEAAFGHLIW